MRTLATLLLVCACTFGQQADGPTYTKSMGVPNERWTRKLDYSGTTLIYAGYARNDQKVPWRPSIANGELTSIVDSSNTSTVTTVANHGLTAKNKVCIYGASVSALNGCYSIQTVGSATTFTITTSGVADATYNNAALYMTTLAARTSQPVWTIFSFTYDGSSNLTDPQVSLPNSVWDNRAVSTGATMTTYN